MEVNFWWLLVASLCIFGGLDFLILKITERSFSQISLFFIIMSSVLSVVFVEDKTTKKIAVIYANQQYEDKSFWGDPSYTMPNGEEITLYGLKRGRKYIVNTTDDILVIYPVVYGEKGDSYEWQEDDVQFIGSGSYDAAVHNPDFYFSSPESISVQKNIFESLWEFITNSNNDCEVRYFLRALTPEELEELWQQYLNE